MTTLTKNDKDLTNSINSLRTDITSQLNFFRAEFNSNLLKILVAFTVILAICGAIVKS